MTQNKTLLNFCRNKLINFCPYHSSRCNCNHMISVNNVDQLKGLPIVCSTDDCICNLDIYHERKKLCPMLDGQTQ
jgi:hypothetical protein